MSKKGRKIRIYEKCFKRLFDIVLSFLALVILSPVLLVVAILVRIKLGSPVIFKQERPGKDEKIFRLYKFRTMTDKRDKNGKLLPDEKRLTKFGKRLRSTSLDELPELFNILKGDMSFVGPRPLLVKYLSYYTEKERHRHDLRPGLTGLAQVNGRNDLSWDERFKTDLDYIKRMSFFLDLKIILITVKKVLKKEDIQVGEELKMMDLDKEREGFENSIIRIDYNFFIAHKQEVMLLMKELAINNDDLKRIMENLDRFLRDDSAMVLCYRECGAIVGILWAFYIEKKRKHINYFVVDGNYRGKGIGRFLIQRFLEQLKSDESAELLVDKDNKRAICLYESVGFETVCYNREKRKMVFDNKKDRK